MSSTCNIASLFLRLTVAVCHLPSSTRIFDSTHWNQSSWVAEFTSFISVSVYISWSFPPLKPSPIKSRGRIPILRLHIRRPESLYVRNLISYLMPREPLFLKRLFNIIKIRCFWLFDRYLISIKISKNIIIVKKTFTCEVKY